MVRPASDLGESMGAREAELFRLRADRFPASNRADE
jgi:hypothetical protein